MSVEPYLAIDNGICPDCGDKMKNVERSGSFLDKVCDRCGIRWHFNDDMGPGSYSATYIEGGKFWTLEKLNNILSEIKNVWIKTDKGLSMEHIELPKIEKSINKLIKSLEKG